MKCTQVTALSLASYNRPLNSWGRSSLSGCNWTRVGRTMGRSRVIPISHRKRRRSTEQVASWQQANSVTCTVPVGGALLMRSFLLDASSICVVPKLRRVSIWNFPLRNYCTHWNDTIGFRTWLLPLAIDLMSPKSRETALPETGNPPKSQYPRSRRNIKGRPFWRRVWVVASIPIERNALNG
jgi:hypothetical protein